jgi:hypothetical protein
VLVGDIVTVVLFPAELSRNPEVMAFFVCLIKLRVLYLLRFTCFI